MTLLVSLIVIFWVVIYPGDSANQLLEGYPIHPHVGLWFIERGILHLDYAFLGFALVLVYGL